MDDLESNLNGDSVFNGSSLTDPFDIGDLFTNSVPSLQLQPFPDHVKGKSILPQSTGLSTSLLFPGEKPWQRLGNTARADSGSALTTKDYQRTKAGASKTSSEPSSNSGNGSSSGEPDSGNSSSRSPPTVEPKSSRSASVSQISKPSSGSSRIKTNESTRRRNAGKAKSAAERRRDIRSRKERARVSARDCRARKKEYVQDLEHKAQYLESENLEQQTRLKQMSDRIAELEAHIRRQQTNQAIWAAANMTLGIDTSSEEGIGHGGT